MDGRIDEAFAKIDRILFLPKHLHESADIDAPLPIGHGQTNSQPYTVRLMLEWLEPKIGDQVLDVGSGSGWTTALLGHLVTKKGRVYAVERIPELVEFGRDNVLEAGITNAEFYAAGEEFGLPEGAPYDRILVSASADELPKSLVDQLKPGGKMVIPVQNDILEITKDKKGALKIIPHPDFWFVPLL